MKNINQLLKRAKKIQSEIDMIGAKYSELNDITAQLLKLKFKGNATAIIRDNFKKKNVVFRTTSVKRYELEFLK